MADILSREIDKAELPRSCAFPDEIGIERCCIDIRRSQQFSGGGSIERQQHVGGLHLRAAAMRALNLIRRRTRRKNRADLDVAVFLVKEMHGWHSKRRNDTRVRALLR